MKKIFFRTVVALLVILLTYKILSSITRYSIDKTVTITAPSSSKSQAEVYAFGYQPALSYSEPRETCANRYPLKKAMFGDLHIHTAISADAFPDGTRTFPNDVYRFAKGSIINVPTKEGQPQRTLQLKRPLDFAAVTDHAETFGEGYICRTKGAFAGYDSKSCQTFRKGGEKGVRVFMVENAKVRPVRDKSVCGEQNQDCQQADRIVWQDMIDWAEQAYDKTENCNFTSFIGYEYTRAPNAQHMHRNTIFKNTHVPDRPATFFSHPSTYTLLQSFETECRLGMEDCDVISIPHNSNISGGNAFNPREVDGFSEQSQQAHRSLRNAYDRLMEITQHKGTSECLNGVTDILGDVDELCNVEALRQFGQKGYAFDLNAYLVKFGRTDSPDCSVEHFDDKDNLYKGFCLSSRDFARGALLEGMKQEDSYDVNPFEFGFIGSSDTHIGAAGAADEASWSGHIAYETDLEGRLGEAASGRFNRLVSNPGGLAGVYAVENSRDALFQSMKRREAFATSGPRIEPRFFAGTFDDDLCDQTNWLELAYANGTPMGSKLKAPSEGFALLAQAKRDLASRPLEKLQLIKGWLDDDGQKHTKVIDLVTNNKGAEGLCAVYRDPHYDPKQRSYYYVRAVEQESTRWSHAQCQALAIEIRPKGCENDMPNSIYEMAWTSPIWFTPNDQTHLSLATPESLENDSSHGHSHSD